MIKTENNITPRQREIADKFLSEIDKHIAALLVGNAETSYGVKYVAELLFINPNHLSDTIKYVLGKSPCPVYEEKIIETCKDLLTNTTKPINEIASTFSYEPTHFTKFFKRYTHTTPSRFRKLHFQQKTEKNTI